MSKPLPKLIAGLFYSPDGFEIALAELRWTVRQNPAFWSQALIYVDPLAETRFAPYRQYFGEVVVDHHMPPEVLANRKWCCKGWWSKQAVDRFDSILYCDFDIIVRRHPDAALADWLGKAPRFLYMPNYQSPHKVVGCGVAYYDRSCNWDCYLDLIYHKWRCDERAWTETLSMTKEKQLEQGLDMNPKIVNWDWLLTHPDQRLDTYIIHGLSEVSGGWQQVPRMGFQNNELNFSVALRARLNHWLTHLKTKR